MKAAKKLLFLVTLFALLLPYTVMLAEGERGRAETFFDDYTVVREDGSVEILSREKVSTYDASTFEDYQKENTVYTVKKNGVVRNTYNSLAGAVESVTDSGFGISAAAIAPGDVEIIENNLTYGTDTGVVIFKNTSSTVTYINRETGADTYISPSYAPDAAYLGMEGNTVYFRQAGCIGAVPKDSVYVMTYEDFKKAGYVTSVYRVSNGKLYHCITTDLRSYTSKYTVGYIQPYMSEGMDYFSFDGHYFYTTYEQMVKDYIAGTTAGAINPDRPYYNYYQYLSHRTTAFCTAQQINEYIAARTAVTSKLQNTGDAFVSHQNTYGSNALLMFGLAVNESAWGNSKLAMDKNNLFGHGAVDSNPYYGANGYASPNDSINYHAQYFVSRGYLDPTDWRYFGPHLGDKNSGMNVKYASDPYWGEKAASQAYLFSEYFEEKNDLNKYTLLIGDGDQRIYKNPAQAGYFYSTGNGSKPYPTLDFPFTVLETVTGETVNGSNVWYKIATDPDLKDDRSGFIIRDDGTYHPSNSYGYVHESQVKAVVKKEEPPKPPVTDPVKIYGGDINGDGRVEAKDVVIYARYLADWDIQIDAGQADLNQSGKIETADIVLLKRYLAGWNYELIRL